ncbi:MAG: hypothetical protein FWH10_05835 [Oscillospiraceae bacterium]|nr:hypothetical protein [Oscillospiraceae bacterium]
MGFYEQLGVFFENAARTALYLLLMIPLLLVEIMGEAVDVISGVKDAPRGAPLYLPAEAGSPPLCEYDEYICFDLDRMNMRRGGVFSVDMSERPSEEWTYQHLDRVVFDFVQDPGNWGSDATAPFHRFDKDIKGSWMKRAVAIWNRSAPKAFLDQHEPKKMANYIDVYYRVLYAGNHYNSFIYTLDGKVLEPVSYQYDGETYYYLPGDEAGRTGRFTTRRAANEDYTRRTLNLRANYVDIYPSVNWYVGLGVEPSDGNYSNLGPGITFLTKEQVARRAQVRYGKMAHDGFHSYQGNLLNDTMVELGYPDFRYYDGVEYWVNFKYWLENSLTFHCHMFSLQFYFSVKPMWRGYIDNNPKYVADDKKKTDDPARYTEEFLAWMKTHNITPGTEKMYEELSKFINQGRNLGAISADGAWGGNIINLFFNSSVMNYLFWGMTLIALALCAGCSIAAVVRSTGDYELKRPVGQVVGSIAKTMLTFLLVPLFMIIVINMSGIVLRQVSQAFDLGITGSNQQPASMATTIIASSLTEESMRDVPEGAIKSAELEKRKQRLLSGGLYWKEAGQFISIFDPFKMYLVPAVITAWFSIAMMIMIFMIFSRRVYELLLLYIASPFTVCSMPLDGGAKFKAWREMFISKVLSGFSSIFTLKLALLMMPVLWTGGITIIDYNSTYDTVIKLMIMAGGMYAAYKSHTLINNLLNLGGSNTDKETATFAAQNTFIKAGSAAWNRVRKIDKGVWDFGFNVAGKTITHKSDQKKAAVDGAKKRSEAAKKEKGFTDLLPVKDAAKPDRKSEKELRKNIKTLNADKKRYAKAKKSPAKKSGENQKYKAKKKDRNNNGNNGKGKGNINPNLR